MESSYHVAPDGGLLGRREFGQSKNNLACEPKPSYLSAVGLLSDMCVCVGGETSLLCATFLLLARPQDYVIWKRRLTVDG